MKAWETARMKKTGTVTRKKADRPVLMMMIKKGVLFYDQIS